MRRSLKQIILLNTLVLLGGFGSLGLGAINPQALQCEYRSAPVGIDALHPRLSWELTSKERGEQQTQYRILVASSQKLLAAQVGDVALPVAPPPEIATGDEDCVLHCSAVASERT